MSDTRSVVFYGLEFEITSDVLKPYKATERLVLAAIERKPTRFADIGTGSGNIVVSMLKHLTESTAIATDISPAALFVARRNAERHGVSDRVEFVCCDALDAVDDVFDLIVSNPPYSPTPATIPTIPPISFCDGGHLESKLAKFSPVLREGYVNGRIEVIG